MKSLKKAFLYAITVTLLINGLGFFINAIFITNLDEATKDILYLGPISFSLFFVPCFFSALYYKDTIFKDFKNTLKLMIKPMAFSFVIIYFLVFLRLNLLRDYSIPFFNSASFPNGTFAALIYVFSTLILFLKKSKTNRKARQLKLKPLKVGFIWLLITTIYLLLQIAFGNGVSIENYRVLILPFYGFIVALLTFIVFNTKQRLRKPVLIFSFLYIFNCFGVLLIYMLSVIDLNKFETPKLISLYIQGIVVFTPYLLLITLAIHAYYMFLKNKTEKESLKQTSVSANIKYQQLKAQLSPHFLFNNISVLTGLIEENPKRAIEFSEKLSSIYRYFLDQENQELVLLQDELLFGKAYMDLLKVRYENALQVSIVLENLSGYYILPFALQQVFENIIKHNEITKEKSMQVRVNLQDEYLIIENTLNFKLADNSQSKTGLENLKERYSYFTDQLIQVNSDVNSYCIKLPLLKV